MKLLQQYIEEERIKDVIATIKLGYEISQIQSIELLPGGYSSSKNYKIKIADDVYVLRVMGLDQPLADRETQIECLSIASKEKLAPFCIFANAETGIIFMDYIEPKRLNDSFDFLGHLANKLFHLHSLKFPKPYKSTFQYTEELEETIKTVPLSKEIKTFFNHITEIKKILSPHLILAACHNDLNPNNYIFNGVEIFFIDWEAAGEEDPYFDLATVCNFFTAMAGETAENYFLVNYFGYDPSKFERSKLFLMKQISYYFYALHFLQFASNAGLSLANELVDVPTYPQWTEGFSTKKYNLSTGSDFLLLANVFIQSALKEINTEEFNQAKEMLR